MFSFCIIQKPNKVIPLGETTCGQNSFSYKDATTWHHLSSHAKLFLSVKLYTFFLNIGNFFNNFSCLQESTTQVLKQLRKSTTAYMRPKKVDQMMHT